MTIDPIDADQLPVHSCLQLAELGTRAGQIHGHEGRINAAWWNKKLTEYRLPGGPVVGEERRCDNGSLRCYVSRGDVFALAWQQPEAAYRRLWNGRHGELKYLGPSFLTKFLYFVGGGCQNHPCLILDRRVAWTLVRCGGWASLMPDGGWPAWTYGRYCRLVRRWAVEETVRRRRLVCPDEVDRWLWEHTPSG